MKGWLVNDCLTCIPGTKTLWHDLLEWIPGLEEKTNGYTDFSVLADVIERQPNPDYIIRNASYFRPIHWALPQYALLQDIMTGPQRALQYEVAQSSTIVFNSGFTRSYYSDIKNFRVIPLGINFDLFKPQAPQREKWGIAEGSILFVGSGDAIKGFSRAVQIMQDSPRPCVFVMKDDANVPVAKARVFRRLSHQDMIEVMNCCSVGLVTSQVETQHLAGLEMGACGVPLVTTNVGAYFGRPEGPWGCIGKDFGQDIERVVGRQGSREYWQKEGFDRDSCARAWRELVL